MAQNTNPVFCLQGNIGFAIVNTADTDHTGGGGTLAFTAHATNGSRVERIKIRALGTNIATVFRVWINNGSTVGTDANTSLFTELTIAATTLSEVAALADNEIPMNLVLPPGYKIYVSVGTTIAAGLDVTVVGGDY